jgi:hypothetical protein
MARELSWPDPTPHPGDDLDPVVAALKDGYERHELDEMLVIARAAAYATVSGRRPGGPWSQLVAQLAAAAVPDPSEPPRTRMLMSGGWESGSDLPPHPRPSQTGA